MSEMEFLTRADLDLNYLKQPIHKDYNGSWYSIKWPHYWAIQNQYNGNQRPQWVADLAHVVIRISEVLSAKSRPNYSPKEINFSSPSNASEFKTAL